MQESAVQVSKCQAVNLPDTCWLEQSDHVITMGPEKEAVFRVYQAFITTTVKGAAVETALPPDVHRYAVGETFPDR